MEALSYELGFLFYVGMSDPVVTLTEESHEKLYVVRLSPEERAECQAVIKKLSGSSQKVRRAQMLLKADQGSDGPNWTDERIAEAFDARL